MLLSSLMSDPRLGISAQALTASAGYWKPERFGVYGDGRDNYVNAQRMWDDLPSGAVLVYTPGGRYLQSQGCAVDGKSLTVIAKGATVGLLPGAPNYTLLAVNRGGSIASMIDYFHWYGGLVDGDGFNQSYLGSSWPGSDDTNHNTLGNTGLVGVWYCQDAMASFARVTRSVAEGFCFSICQSKKFIACHGYNGVPLRFGVNGLQGAFFKTHDDPLLPYATGHWSQCTAVKGSIAFHAQSSTPAVTGSTSTLEGCASKDMAQNSFHIEAASGVQITNPNVRCTDFSNPLLSGNNIQITSDTTDFTITGGHVDGCINATEATALVRAAVIASVINDMGPAATANFAVDIGPEGVLIAGTVKSAVRGGARVGDVSGGTRFLGWGPGTPMLVNLARLNGATGQGGGATGANANNGIQTFQGGSIDNLTITDVAAAVQHVAGDMKINNLTSSRTGRSAILLDAPAGRAWIRNSHLADFGIDTGSAASRRAAIGGSGGNGAESVLLDMHDVMFEKTGSVGDANNQRLYRNLAAASSTIDFDHVPIGMATPSTFVANGGTLTRRTSDSGVSVLKVPMTTSASAAVSDYALNVPAGETILRMFVDTNVAFGAGTDVQFEIGSSAGLANYVAPLSVKAQAVYPLTLLPAAAKDFLVALSSMPNVFVRLTQTGTLSAIGSAFLVIETGYAI